MCCSHVITFYCSFVLHILFISIVSPEVKTLFVFTDDESWLESEKIRVKSKYPEWKIINLEAPKVAALENKKAFQKSTISAEYEIMRYGGGSQSGAYFLGSLQLAQQCEGFVGMLCLRDLVCGIIIDCVLYVYTVYLMPYIRACSVPTLLYMLLVYATYRSAFIL